MNTEKKAISRILWKTGKRASNVPREEGKLDIQIAISAKILRVLQKEFLVASGVEYIFSTKNRKTCRKPIRSIKSWHVNRSSVEGLMLGMKLCLLKGIKIRSCRDLWFLSSLRSLRCSGGIIHPWQVFTLVPMWNDGISGCWYFISFNFTVHQRSFHTCLSVILSGVGRGVPITHDALDLTYSPPPSKHETWGPPPPDMGQVDPPGSDIWRPSLETCSNLFIGSRCTAPSIGTDIWWWPPKLVWLASERYASYWNAFLFYHYFLVTKTDGSVHIY